MNKKRLIIFASGTKDGGGSGFETLAKKWQSGYLNSAIIVAVVSNHEHGGVHEKANRLGIPFEYFPSPWTAERYQEIVAKYNADFVALSGWLKLVVGLDPRTTFNIHPGPLPKFGGKGMYGHHVHEAVHAAFESGEIDHTEVTMHFVTEEYDRGPTFFVGTVQLFPGDTADSIAGRVNKAEHAWQWMVTELVVSGAIKWDGHNPQSLQPPRPVSLSQRER